MNDTSYFLSYQNSCLELEDDKTGNNLHRLALKEGSKAISRDYNVTEM